MRGSPRASPARAPTRVARFHSSEDGQAGHPEPEPRGWRIVLCDSDGRRLVDRQVGGGRGAPAPHAQDPAQLQRVEAVAHAEHRGRRDRGRCGRDTPGADDADEGEVRPAGEHHEREDARLPHGQAGGHRERTDTDAVGAGGESDGEALTPDGAPLARSAVRSLAASASARCMIGVGSERRLDRDEGSRLAPLLHRGRCAASLTRAPGRGRPTGAPPGPSCRRRRRPARGARRRPRARPR